ncbi:hypothetical protein [Haloarcula halophila]|uniref:hypothetical protein n=1 Tax=Haloarcula TaxID=2237 RepID=UPI0023E419BC|nr:hypothetical protein [Halomicroarcula sp. DFY41]
MSETFKKGDVVWAPDPFREGQNPRLWLVLSAEGLPYQGEEYICAVLTTSDLPANDRVGENWETGRNPDKESYCSPWVIDRIFLLLTPAGTARSKQIVNTLQNSRSWLPVPAKTEVHCNGSLLYV